MDVINWLLINLASAFWWLWDAVVAAFCFIGRVLDAILNPVLSPVLDILNAICTSIADGVYAVLGLFPVWLGLTIVSAIAGVVALVAFGCLSNQPAIGRAKDDIKANLLALKLYKDEIRVTLRSQWRLLCAIGRLQRYMLAPMLILLLPMMLLLAQMGVRYQWRPVHVGEQVNVRLKLAEPLAEGAEITLVASSGVVVEAGPAPGGGEVWWRLRAAEPGTHRLTFSAGAATVAKELVVGDEFRRVSAVRPGRLWTRQLLHPIERVLPRGGAVEFIEIEYPDRESWFSGANWWVLSFFVISMLVAILLRPVFNVKF
ncbi:MAG: protease inhibitor I42 family protein [Planctomycetes bacterium]|nr:protease inhibitor I42 family protein [Planctomycetota bacterium]